LNGSSGVGDAGRMAGPSAALRYAQDDEFGVGGGEQATTTEEAGSLRE